MDEDLTTDHFSSSSTTRDSLEFDPGGFIGGTGGYDFGFARVEGELSYKHAEIGTITDRDNGTRYRGVDGNLGVFAFMGNAFLDLRNSTSVTPYLGGGIGTATLYISNTYGSSNASRSVRYFKDEDSVFAWQAGAGAEIAINRRFSLDLGYRYFATTRAKFNDDWAQTTDMKFKSHNAAVGVRFKF
jgi:opacity protein-like surface antigen